MTDERRAEIRAICRSEGPQYYKFRTPLQSVIYELLAENESQAKEIKRLLENLGDKNERNN